MTLDPTQKIQEDAYQFPYHYIAQFRPHFNQCYYFAWGINYAASLEFILQQLSQEPFETLIDVGCGDGRITQEVGRRFPQRSIEGVDYSQRAVQLAQLMNPRGQYRCADILQDDWGQRYDIALLIEVFEHIPPERGPAFLAAIAQRLLRPGGRLHLTVPHRNLPLDPKHYRHFTLAELQALLADCFEIEHVIFLEQRSWQKGLIDLLLGNKLFILNSTKLKNILYRLYKQHLLLARSERHCNRLYIQARAKAQSPGGC